MGLGIGLYLGYLVFVIIVFLVCREVVCWYWKINVNLELQRDILKELKKLNGEKIIEEFDPSAPRKSV